MMCWKNGPGLGPDFRTSLRSQNWHHQVETHSCVSTWRGQMLVPKAVRKKGPKDEPKTKPDFELNSAHMNTEKHTFLIMGAISAEVEIIFPTALLSISQARTGPRRRLHSEETPDTRHPRRPRIPDCASMSICLIVHNKKAMLISTYK